MKKSGLGPLELKVLSVLSELKKATVKEIYLNVQKQENDLALNTIATVLDRLYKKGLIERELVDDKKPYYVYRFPEEIMNNKKAMDIFKDFIKAFKEPLKFYFESKTDLSEEEIEKIFESLEG